ncbi:helix-turn-helix domain-containing protein [Zunongwangia pacifica]|uniref:AraC family transcriptional regulator n=1 Tax=Zunongwangia pacifica TaxID=2911062 RepID=A0A9X2CP35_9FLAO|nr:AraC family transcriptional regulator [Zunongwangia pacifica]MCL6219449.1 AraC family transcriptional regulator [Zunongwangia pacifica]
MLANSFSLLNVDHVQLNNRWNYKNVISPYYRLYYIDGGEGKISSPTKKLILRPGYLYLIPSFTLCNLECDDFMSQYFLQFFEESPDGISLFKDNRSIMEIKATDTDISIFNRLLKINPGRGINRSDDPEVYEKEAYYKEHKALNKDIKTSVQFENQGIILILLSRFIESIRFKSLKIAKIPSVVLEAINYIQLNLGNSITINDLAKNANQNRDYFSRQFLEHTGQRPLSFIHEKRIERAQYLIVTTNKTLLDIAIETGFNNLPHFTKIFKKKVNKTPGAYRKQSLQIT